MARIEFYAPFWGNVELRTFQDLYDTIELAQKHCVEKDISRFSRVHTTSYLLLTVALSFFQAFPYGAKAFTDGALHYYENKTDEATEALYNYGSTALKHVAFAVYQLGLTVWALAFPGDVTEMLTLHKPLVLKPGTFSKEPDDPTNLLMFQNEALRSQVSLLQSERSTQEVLEELLKRNEGCETRIEEARFLAHQNVEYAESLAEDNKKEATRLTKELANQKYLYEKQIKELEAQHEKRIKELEAEPARRIEQLEKQVDDKNKLWAYIKEYLQGGWKELRGEELIAKVEYVEARPAIYSRKF